ncbi:MFS transporter [Novosphingobium sp. FSY-8]|uniref:MFS transporter n=1 Tax=Novosphingobium ovatum TaxID=1908523 RepID=A0ABW9XBR2_9SPHN|nr:MFS transporter [Novosphingobium ovatum]NBC35971.1 MFS transporter [Novosphingobium ovatum]
MASTHTATGADASSPALPPSSSLWRIRCGSLLIPLGHAAAQNIVTVLGLRFLTDNMGLAAGIAGIIFAVVKIYDGLLDPAVGAWSDNLRDGPVRRTWGRRLPFLFAGGLAMPLGVAMVFGAPDFGSVLMAQAFVTLALVIHATGYTLLTIPGFAMVVEASSDHHERTRLMAWRVLGNSLGMLVGSVLPTKLLAVWGTSRAAHLHMALVIAGIVLVVCLLAVWLLRDAPRTLPDPAAARQRYSLGRQAVLAWANRPFRTLAMAHVLLLLGTAIGSSAMAYFSRYVLFPGNGRAADGWLAGYFFIATIATVGSMPLWVRATAIIGKKAGYMGAMSVYALMQLAWLTASPTEGYAVLVARGVIVGLASGGMILCAYAMLSDAVRYDYIQSGERREGAFAGFTTLFDKLSSALALALMGWILAAMGYAPSVAGGGVAQSASAIWGIKLCLAVIPAGALLGAVLIVAGYDLDPAQLHEDAA